MEEEEEKKSEYNQDYEDDRNLLFKNIDAKVDPFSILLEKEIQKLPDSLQFIKEYLYFDFLPKIDILIEDLEKIKSTPNYDEKLVNIRPISIRTPDSIITCIDMLANHNIKHPKISRMIYGTINGFIKIYDIEIDKIVCEKNISQTNRVDSIATSTTKYFDTYITRIAVNCRSEIFIHIISYNHSFTVMNEECVINTVNPTVADPIANSDLNLMYVINSLSFSKDGFYLSAIDYAGGVRLYKFHEIPQSYPSIQTTETIQSKSDQSALQNTSKKDKDKDKDKAESKPPAEKTKQEKGSKGDAQKEDLFIFIKRIECDLKENFTILPNEIGNPSEGQTKEKQDKKAQKKPPEKQQPAKGKGKGKDKDNKQDSKEPSVPLDPTLYNIKSEYDESLPGDVSLYQKYDNHHPIIHFIQKNFIFEEKYSSGYSNSTVTIGVYISFINTTCFKYISLYPYLTDRMKTIFKVAKVKTGSILSVEETMSLTSHMIRKEKEYLNFIRSKIDNNPNATIAQKKDTQEQKETKGKDDKKDDKKKDQSKTTKEDNRTQLEKLNEITKNEISFTTLFNISAMAGQKYINDVNNLLAIGMTDGTILVWDCELHTDKFLFQKNSRYEITTLSVDENFLLCGTNVGQIYIYDLITGNEIYNCVHNPYEAIPLSFALPFFIFFVVAFDINNKVCIYNTKEKEKIAKIALDEIDTKDFHYVISYCNKYLVDFNEEFAIFLCNKSTEQVEKPSLLDLIHYQEKRREILRNKPHETSTDFFNKMQIESNGKAANQEIVIQTEISDKEQNPQEENAEVQLPEPITRIEVKQNYFLVFRVKEILFKCYPNLVYSYKKGLSLNKILKRYSANEFPTFEKSKFLYSILYL